MNDNSPNNKGAGKGDSPRNCFSKEYKDNYDLIDWSAHKRTNKNTVNPNKDINQQNEKTKEHLL